LAGVDIIEAIRFDYERLEKDTTYVIPWSIFNTDELTLDGYTPEQIVEECNRSIVEVTCGSIIEKDFECDSEGSSERTEGPDSEKSNESIAKQSGVSVVFVSDDAQGLLDAIKEVQS
jgi:hypothetical protein